MLAKLKSLVKQKGTPPPPRRKRKPRNTEPQKQRTRYAEFSEKVAKLQEDKQKLLPGTWTIDAYNEFHLLLVELMSRDAETLGLYRPLPIADQFHRCMAHEVALSGSNRAGKTCASAAEVAMAAMGIHYVEGKYPKEALQICCVGNDGKHLSLMYEYLFEKAQFRVFLHPETFEWKVVVEDDPEHRKHMDLWRGAPPLIPQRMVESVAWESAPEKIPNLVRLHNGTEFRFFSALVRKIPRGRKFHLVWIDEEIEYAKEWLEEMRPRIVDYNGRIIWSATPQNATEEFYKIGVNAKDPLNETLPLSQQSGYFIMLNRDNIYLPKEGVDALAYKFKDDDEVTKVRMEGLSALDRLKVYPEFGEYHTFENARLPGNIIPTFNMRYQDTRYVIIDPGVDVAGVIFVACPEPVDSAKAIKLDPWEKMYRLVPDVMVVYDECYVTRATPQLVAMAIKTRLHEHKEKAIYDFTIDQKGGKSLMWKGMPSDKNAESLYMEEILKVDIVPMKEGWRYGSSDVDYGIGRVRSYIQTDFETEQRQPRLFVTKNCKHLLHEFNVWKKKRDARGNFIGYEDKNHHLLDCVRYATTRPIKWVPVEEPTNLPEMTSKDLNKIMDDLRSGKSFFPGVS